MKRLILFLVVFIYIYPVSLRALPLPLDRVLEVIGLGVLILHSKDLAKILGSKSVHRFLGLSFILLIFGILPQFLVSGTHDFYFIKTIINVFLYFFSAYLIYLVVHWCYGEADIGIILYYIVLAAVAQVIISGFFFLNPQLFLSYSSLLKQGDNEHLFSRLSLLNLRLIGIGSSFFGGVIKYGVAFFSVLILPYLHRNWLTSNKVIYWCSVLIIFTGGMLTSRSFIVAFGLGVLMITLLRSENILRFIGNNLKVLLLILISLPILYFIVTLFLNADRINKIFGFVFELFINYFSGQGLQSSSTNTLMEMYVLPDSVRTWLLGDGKMVMPSGSYYMHTDVGYLRLIYYFGLPATLIFIYVLCRYYKILSSFEYIKPLKYFLVTLFSWILILNFKGFTFESYYFVLFLLFLVLPRAEAEFAA